MPLNINTNVASLNAQRFLTNNTSMLSKSMEKLSSGYRINRAGDDAAGLALSEKLRSQIRGSQKAQDNVQDGINVLNITDGAMQSVTDCPATACGRSPSIETMRVTVDVLPDGRILMASPGLIVPAATRPE